jgi:hypothetical protein
MNEKIQPLAAIRRAYARGIITRTIAFLITLFAAVSFFQERHKLESQLLDLHERLAFAESKASQAASAQQEAERSMFAMEESLRDAESKLSGSAVYLDLPMGYVEAHGYSSAELTLLSCNRIMVAYKDAADHLDHGVALVEYNAWDRSAVREMLDSADYRFVGKASSTSNWDGSGDLHYYMLREVRDRRDFAWPDHKKWNDAFWDWQNYLKRECRRQR